jgi:hypothetical protein
MRIAGKSSRSSSAYGDAPVQRVPGKGSRSAKAYGGEGGDLDAGRGGVQENAARGTAGSASALPFLPFIQASFGRYDISGVRAHTDSAAQGACEDIGAHAYASGNAVAFGGAPDLHTAAHEAAHIVQQRHGVQVDGGVGRAGDFYELHADRVADAVVAGRSAEKILDEIARPAAARTPAAAAPAPEPAAAPVQKKSNLAEVTAQSTIEEKIHYVDSYTMADILDTLSGPKGKPLLDELLANEAKIPPAAADRLGSALRAAGGHIDHVFWMMFGRMHGGPFAGECAVIEARVGKKNMSAEKRLGTISSSVISDLRSVDEPDRIEAFKYLNGLNMKDILDVLVLGSAAGVTGARFETDVKKAPVNHERLIIAAMAVDGFPLASIEKLHGPALTALGADGDLVRDFITNSPKSKFIALFGGDPLVIAHGQFQLITRVREALLGLTSLAPTPETQEHYERVVNASGNRGVEIQKIDVSAGMLRDRMTGSVDPALQSAIGPFHRMQGDERATGYALFGEWWAEYQKAKTPPPVNKLMNIHALHAIAVAAADQCGAHTGNLANLAQGKEAAAGKKKDPAARFSAGLGNGVKRDFTPLPGDVTRGDAIQYGGNLADSVAKMKAALDGGWYLHTRVVSGGGARTPHPQPLAPGAAHGVSIGDPTEHSLLIVGYRGNAFIVSDSDPMGELDTQPQDGFTTIYYDAASNRLSTAVEDGAFPVTAIDDGKGGKVLGDHHPDGRHRYQVWSVTSQ